MALTKLNEDLNVIEKLSNLPNQTDKLTAQQLKEKFDEAVNVIKTYINEVLTQEIDDSMAAISSGVPSGAQIGTTKIADNAVTYAKLAKGIAGYEAVGTDTIRDGAVTAEKLAGDIPFSKISGNIPVTRLESGIPIENIAGDLPFSRVTGDVPITRVSGSITSDRLAGGIPMSKLDGGTVQAKCIAISGGFTTGSDNTNYISNSNIHASSNLVISPTPNSFASWRNYGFRAVEQGDGFVRFASDVAGYCEANILILN